MQKARRQRDAAREQATRDGDQIADLTADLAKITLAVHDAEKILKIRRGGTADAEWVSHADVDDRITRIAEIACRALHTALVAQSHNRTQMLAGQEAHFLEYALTPQMIDLAHGDVLLESTVNRLRERFQAEGYPTRTIVVRVQDW